MADLGRILIADDDETFSKSTAELLHRKGYHCDCVPDAPSAAEKLRNDEYDLLIADIKMPGNPELELIRDMPNIAEGLPVILVTGYPDVHSAIQSIELPVDGYLVKPLDFDELLRHVQTAIERVRVYRTICSTRDRLRRWYEELGSIEKVSKDEGRRAPSVSLDAFLELTFENITAALADLKHLTKALVTPDVDKEPCHLFNCPKLGSLAAGLTETIDALEESKRAFKSRDLGEIRRKLEQLVPRKA